MGTLYCQRAPSFGWDVKPRSWLSVVIKNPMSLIVKSVLAKFPPLALVNHGLPIIPIHLIGSISLSSPPVAGVWWAHWRRCAVAAVASSKWMLHTGGGWRETPSYDCKALWVYSNTQLKRYINDSFIHSKSVSQNIRIFTFEFQLMTIPTV